MILKSECICEIDPQDFEDCVNDFLKPIHPPLLKFINYSTCTDSKSDVVYYSALIVYEDT